MSGMGKPGDQQTWVYGASADVWGASNSGRWTSVYDVNLCTLTPGTTYANGANTISGLTWTGVNIAANASEVKIYSDGLHLHPNANNTDWFTSVNTAPQLYTRFADLIPDFSPANYELRVWLQWDSINCVHDYEFASAGLQRTRYVPNDCWCWESKKGHAGSVIRITGLLWKTTEAVSTNDTGGTSNNLTMWHWRDTRRVDFYTGLISAADSVANSNAWPTVQSLVLQSQLLADPTNIEVSVTNKITLATDLCFVLASAPANTTAVTDDFYGCYKRIKIEALKKSS